MSVGPWQIALIALVVILLFGAGRLGDIGKGLGEGIRNFKKGVNDPGDEDEGSDESKADEPKQLKQGDAASADDSEPAGKKEA